MSAGYDISIRLIPFTSEDTHLRAYFVGLLNTLMIAVCGCFLATILGFVVGVIRLSSNWLFRNIAYVYVEFTRNVPGASSNRSLLQYPFTSSKNKASHSSF
jgi:general L-amino acid transport system permease protein